MLPHRADTSHEVSCAGEQPLAPAVRAHLALVLASPPFEASRRSRELLGHLVGKTLRGETGDLKERSLGEDVFGRVGYEPSEQNLVRVAANELRKRLAQYYDRNEGPGIRIDLPRGAYIPAFHFFPEHPPELQKEKTHVIVTGRWRRLIPVMAVVVALATIVIWMWAARPSPEEAFWKPILAAGKPAVIWSNGWGAVMTEQVRSEILKHDGSNEPYSLQVRPNDLIPVDQHIAYGHVYGISMLTAWLAKHGQAPQLRLGNWFTPSDVHDRPLILFGALNNPWTIELTNDLRFRVENIDETSVITDKTDPKRRWSIPGYRKRGYDVALDYGLVTRVTDPSSGQVRISIGGLCHYSSQAAAEFLTTPGYWRDMAQVAPRGWEQMNMQVVLEVRVTQKVPQSPKPVAWYFW